MIDLVGIENHIKKGISKGYRQNLTLKLSVSDFESKIVEYLLTVNVAQELLEWNNNFQYHINLEYFARDFYKNAFIAYNEIRDPNLKPEEAIFESPRMVVRKKHEPLGKENGKIDLVISCENTGFYSDNISLVGIEVKGINQSIKLIKNDIGRLFKALTNTDEVSENSIQACYCVFLERLDEDNEILKKEDVEARKKTCYEKWCSLLRNMGYEGIVFDITLFHVKESSYEDVRDIHLAMASEYSEVAADTGVVTGVLISMKRR